MTAEDWKSLSDLYYDIEFATTADQLLIKTLSKIITKITRYQTIKDAKVKGKKENSKKKVEAISNSKEIIEEN